MKEKLRILMQKENLTASRLADMLGIKPAGISHILSGRNNPGYELICKIVNAFPQVNPYWLLGDSEKMYNDSYAESASLSKDGALLFDFNEQKTEPTEESRPQTRRRNGTGDIVASIAEAMSGPEISRIIILYRDRTFESFTPSGK